MLGGSRQIQTTMAKKLGSKMTGNMFLKREGVVWQSSKMIRGKRLYWSTQTSDRGVADKRAADHWQAVIAEEFGMVDKQRAVRACSTVGELAAAIAGRFTYPAKTTRIAYVSKLRRIIGVALDLESGSDAVAALPLSVLTADLVRKYQAAVVASSEGEEHEEAEQARYSANSMLTQAKGCFASLDAIRAAGVVLPGDECRGFIKAERFRGVKIDTEFLPFTKDEVVLLEAALERARLDNAAVWLGVSLMLWCGLRNSEVLRAPASALREDRGAWFIKVAPAGDVSVKAGGSVRSVPVPGWLAAALRDQARPEVVEGMGVLRLWAPALAVTARELVMRRELSAWVQRVLPGATAPDGRARAAYDLRRQAGSLIMDAQGLEAARDFLGHKTSETTRRWYATRIRALKPIGALVGS
jgi:integrase